ncbi:nucleoside-binding protein [Idiomarina abyssalis]|jgi:nucleoside-specific outer membrane channel protein Tsx|uniref:nucleoside-binding protein n=1 Tax=Idiomarina abyssalis TaxID=86102 RepID=UPI003A917C04|tara:strand:- start:2049 stop:2747 length:699 start_codon:yes stop_codon:yes gene_type:complete
MKKLILVLLLCSSFPFAVNAERYWSDTSLTYLNGSDYEVGDPDRHVLTLEYVGGYSWGKIFSFADRLESDNGDTETYIEFSPEFYLLEFDDNPVKNISFTTTAEVGDGFTNYLYGIGAAFDVPGFQFFELDAYKRNNDGLPNNYQLTASWGLPFSIGETKWMFDGFIDYASGISNVGPANLNFTSQLKWNIAPYFELSAPLYVGIEYVYWRNKFYIDGVTEKNPNLLVKWHF